MHCWLSAMCTCNCNCVLLSMAACIIIQWWAWHSCAIDYCTLTSCSLHACLETINVYYPWPGCWKHTQLSNRTLVISARMLRIIRAITRTIRSSIRDTVALERRVSASMHAMKTYRSYWRLQRTAVRHWLLLCKTETIILLKCSKWLLRSWDLWWD